jgi:hypothetical protein
MKFTVLFEPLIVKTVVSPAAALLPPVNVRVFEEPLNVTLGAYTVPVVTRAPEPVTKTGSVDPLFAISGRVRLPVKPCVPPPISLVFAFKVPPVMFSPVASKEAASPTFPNVPADEENVLPTSTCA